MMSDVWVWKGCPCFGFIPVSPLLNLDDACLMYRCSSFLVPVYLLNYYTTFERLHGTHKVLALMDVTI